MIEILKVSKWFGRHNALSDINLTINKGEVVGLLGPNGAGKTTTMDIISGLLLPTTGEVKIQEMVIDHHSRRTKSLIGYLSDPPLLYEDYSVNEFLVYLSTLYCSHLPAKEHFERVDKLLGIFSLHQVQSKLIRNLSRGFRKRTALAAVFIHDPQILLLDEPAKGLDPEQLIELRKTITAYTGSKTFIISSHNLSEILRVCHRVLIMNHGQIIHQINLNDNEISLADLEAIYLKSIHGMVSKEFAL